MFRNRPPVNGLTHGSKTIQGLLLGLSLSACAGQQLARDARPLTLEDLHHPQERLSFSGSPPRGLTWIDDGHYLMTRRGEDGAEWLVIEAETGASEPFFDAARMTAALEKIDGVEADDAQRMSRRARYTFDAERSAVLLEIDGDLWHYRLGAETARRLTEVPGDEDHASFSPDGTQVAFVRDNDLYVVDVESAAERRLTTDGSENVLNGKLDWLYQEEIYGRGRYRAYWWSPGSDRIAFLRLDETDVPLYTIVDDMPTRPEVTVYPYPKAGDPNPTVRVGIVDVGDGATRWLDLERYAKDEPLVVDVDWSPDGTLAWQVQDREQRWLELVLSDPATGSSRTVLRETTQAWVDMLGSPEWLADGSFLWFSQRDGWKHIYHYGVDGAQRGRLTRGNWEARDLFGVDEDSGWVYFAGTRENAIGLDVYRVRLDGTGLELLSSGGGTHSAAFDPTLGSWIDTWSDLTTPPQVRLFRSDGQLVRVVYDEPLADLARFDLVEPERLQVPTRDGFLMEAILIRPKNIRPGRTYPVFQHTYAGPHAPSVRDRWPGRRGMYWQLLAQNGIGVWICDNRTASGKGAVSAWPAYQNLVKSELADIEDGIAWLRSQPWVDSERIGINGWSFGGSMVSYALTHSKSFRMGIAGGSVTDWHNYDTVYTERYMRTPQNNPGGYETTAPVHAAADLHGELLLVHGALDDNVHPQNTMQFAYELQKAGKPFRLMLYPKSQHGVVDPRLSYHMYAMMFDFTLETLLGE